MRPIRFFVLLLAIVALWAARGAAQPEDLTPPSLAEIEARLVAAGDDPAVAEPTDEVVRTLRAARDAAKRAADSRALAAEHRARTEGAPGLIQQYRDELAVPPPAPASPTAPDNATLDELQHLASQADAELTEARSSLESINQESLRRDERMKSIPVELAGLQTEIDRLRRELSTAPAAEIAPALAEARRARLAAELDGAKAKTAELQAEGAGDDGRRELQTLLRDRAARRVAQAEALVAGWQKLLADRRAREARIAAQQASERDLAAAEQFGALAPIRGQILDLLSDLQGERAVTRRLSAAGADLNETRELLKQRSESEAMLRRRIGAGGAVAYGPSLQGALRDLKDIASYQRRLDHYRRQTADAVYRLEELSGLEARSSDVGSRLAEVLEAMGPDAEANRGLATRLLEQRRTLVRQVQDSYENYAETLANLNTVYAEYLAVSGRMQSFVEEHVFWVRSVPRENIVPSRADFAYDIRWLADRQAWRDSAIGAASRVMPNVPPLGVTLAARPVWHLLVLPAGAAGVVLVAGFARFRLGRYSRRPLPTTGRLQHMSMAGCVWKLALACAAAAPLPAALWLLAAWLGSTADLLSASDKVATPAPLALASGLSRGAFVWLGLGILRGLIRPGAVGASQFRWPEAGLAHMRRQFAWFAPIAIVAAVVIETFNERTNDASPEVLGRTTLAVVLLVIVVLQTRLFSPKRPLIAEYFKRNKGGLLQKTVWVWYPLLVVVALCLALATLAGYVYTALQIQRHLGDTFLFIMAVIVGQALVLRYLQLARRRIAMEAARARLTAQQEGEGKPKDAEIPADIDLNTINQQSRKVIQAVTVVVLVLGLYAVWNEVLPALRWFERLQVLPTIDYIEPPGREAVAAPGPAVASGAEAAPAEKPAGGEGAAPATTPPGGPASVMAARAQGEAGSESLLAEHLSSVTVADIGLAVLLLMLTVSASRNVPGLLEITLLPRLPINAAARYAVFTIARYVVILIGIVAISRTLQIPWRSAQWLAAAFTFGLAFGLQEIFANFVSGLIILFEQPIRVGDTVTVGSASGSVSKIRMRATTITDWDNKELVIPNKTFITDQIVNWTLSNPVTRVVVPVGIAYGSDTELARDILLRVARDCPHTLDEPQPRALFLGFGDSSLSFELRTFIDTIDNLLATKSDLHFRIDRAFREAGIEIAFPQRDLHLRSVDGGILEGFGGKAKDEGGRMKDEG
ncbi:MAG: mechanosensitive ion channel [Phycisphaerales bacterium]|nr:mechanosensitive ion channel [Phycisphaerales bacterium]